MALNQAGLGLSFGGKDDGLKSTIESIESHFGRLNERLGQTGKAINSVAERSSEKRFRNFTQGVGMDKATAGMNLIKDATVGQLNLTAGLESQLQSARIATKKFGAQWGVAGDQLARIQKRVPGLMTGMGLSEEAAISSAYAFDQYGDTLKRFGLDSTEAVAQFADVAGIDMRDFGFKMSQAQKELGFSAQESAQMMADALKKGTVTGDPKAALEGVLAQIDVMRTQRTTMKMSATEVANFSQQASALSRVFLEQGVPASAEFGETLNKSLTDSGKSMTDLVNGVGSDLPALNKALGVSGVGVGESFDLMKKGPLGMMQGFSKLIKEGGKTGEDLEQAMVFIQSHISEAFGPENAAMMMNFLRDPAKRQALDATQIVSSQKEIEDATKAVTKAFENRQTPAERFNTQQELMYTNARKLSGVKTGDFLKESGKSMEAFSKSMADAVAKGGPMGTFVQKLMDVDKFGVAGLFGAENAGLAATFGTVFEKLGPIMGKLTAVAGTLFTVLKSGFSVVLALGWPLLAVVAALGLAFALFRKDGESVGDTFSRLWKDVLQPMWTDLVAYWNTVLLPMWNALKKSFLQFLPEVMAPLEEAWNQLKDTFNFVLAQFGVSASTSTADAQSWGETLGQVFAAIATGIATVINWFVHLQTYVVIVLSYIPYAFEVVGQRIGETFAFIVGVVAHSWDVVSALTKDVFSNMVTLLSNIGKTLINVLTLPLRGLVDVIASLLETLMSVPGASKALGALGIDQNTIASLRKFQAATTLDTKEMPGFTNYGKVTSDFGTANFGALPESPLEKAAAASDAAALRRAQEAATARAAAATPKVKPKRIRPPKVPGVPGIAMATPALPDDTATIEQTAALGSKLDENNALLKEGNEIARAQLAAAARAATKTASIGPGAVPALGVSVTGRT